jgi:hypothetical protein
MFVSLRGPFNHSCSGRQDWLPRNCWCTLEGNSVVFFFTGTGGTLRCDTYIYVDFLLHASFYKSLTNLSEQHVSKPMVSSSGPQMPHCTAAVEIVDERSCTSWISSCCFLLKISQIVGVALLPCLRYWHCLDVYFKIVRPLPFSMLLTGPVAVTVLLFPRILTSCQVFRCVSLGDQVQGRQRLSLVLRVSSVPGMSNLVSFLFLEILFLASSVDGLARLGSLFHVTVLIYFFGLMWCNMYSFVCICNVLCDCVWIYLLFFILELPHLTDFGRACVWFTLCLGGVSPSVLILLGVMVFRVAQILR